MSSIFTAERVEQIRTLALDADSFAYLLMTEQGLLLERGGELNSIELPEWQIGENILDQALFLHGSLPLDSDHESIVCYQLTDSCAIDIHLFKDEAGVLVLLVDRSAETEEEARRRQLHNEAKLRQRYSKERDSDG